MIWSKVSFSILRFTFNFQNKLDLVRVNYFKKYTYHHQFIMEQSQTSSPEPKTPKIEHENSQEIVQNIIQDVVHEIVPSHQLGNLLKQRNLWILWFINIFLWTFVRCFPLSNWKISSVIWLTWNHKKNLSKWIVSEIITKFWQIFMGNFLTFV